MSWLYRYETSGIQRWILDANKLRELKSGSALVEALTGKARELVAGLRGEVLQATAGAVTARFDSQQQLEGFASEWPMYVRYHAPGLHVVQAWIEEGAAGAGLPLLFDALAARRGRAWADLPEAGPWVARVGRSGLPAVRAPDHARRRAPGAGSWDRGMVARALAEGPAGQRLEDLLEPGWSFGDDPATWGDDPVAVVHLDGSGVGRRLRELRTTDQLRGFSNELADATWAATRKAFGRLCAGVETRRERNRRVQARPIVVGGDDVTIVLPAADGFELAVDWMELFEQETGTAARSSIGGSLHCGAGVAFVHAGHPFALAYELAEKACRDAKRAAVDETGAPIASALQFQRVTTSLTTDEQSATTWVLGGPASLPDVKALARLVKACAKLPRGSLRTWLTLVDRADDVGRRATWSRAREIATSRDPAGRCWESFAEALRGAGADPDSGLFQRSGTRTPVRDALALLHLGGSR